MEGRYELNICGFGQFIPGIRIHSVWWQPGEKAYWPKRSSIATISIANFAHAPRTLFLQSDHIKFPSVFLRDHVV